MIFRAVARHWVTGSATADVARERFHAVEIRSLTRVDTDHDAVTGWIVGRAAQHGLQLFAPPEIGCDRGAIQTRPNPPCRTRKQRSPPGRLSENTLYCRCVHQRAHLPGVAQAHGAVRLRAPWRNRHRRVATSSHFGCERRKKKCSLEGSHDPGSQRAQARSFLRGAADARSRHGLIPPLRRAAGASPTMPPTIRAMQTICDAPGGSRRTRKPRIALRVHAARSAAG